ncbi:MAG TPA: recombinase family protein [Gaiellales bacterium]|nr:recombinase family protein [Gaiellales bacterium]
MGRAALVPKSGVGTAAHRVSAAGYIRVSSTSQDWATQRSTIERAAAGRGDTEIRWFEEKASAKTTERAALLELRRAVRAGELRRVYVFRLDRLVRSGPRDMLNLVHEFEACRVELVTLADGFTLEGPARDFILCGIAFAAKLERDANTERLAAARARIERAGKKWGRPFRSPELREKALHLRVNEKKSIRQIAMSLKVPRTTVARWLERPKNPPSDRPPRGAEKPGVKKIHPGPSY